jgi:hypothetical protein
MVCDGCTGEVQKKGFLPQFPGICASFPARLRAEEIFSPAAARLSPVHIASHPGD